MNRWKALFLTLLAFASCVACTAPMPAKNPPACRHEVGVVERAFSDALAALSIPAAANGVPLEALPIRMLDTHGAGVAAVTFAGYAVCMKMMWGE